MRRVHLIILLLTISLPILSQNSDNKIVPGNGNYFFQINNRSIFKRDLNYNIIDSLKFPTDKIKLNNIDLIEYKGNTFLVSIGGGMIWKTNKDTIFRIDNSFNHKMTYSSKVFVHNDTIFKYGGYGYWSARNFFTYFSESTKEWEFYSINPASILPPGIHNPNTAFSNGKLYVTGGAAVDSHNGLSRKPNNNVWSFSFKSKLWTDLGVSKFYNYVETFMLDNLEGGHFVTNKTSDDFPDHAYFLDYDKNKIISIDNYNGFPFSSGFVKNDTVYCVNNGILKKRNLNHWSFQDNNKPLYLDTAALFNGLTNFVIFALLILFLLLLFLHNKNKNKPKVDQSGFRYDRVHYSLSKKELIVLNMLIHNKNIDSKSLLEKIWDSSLSVPQNNRIKLEVIDSLNEKISKVLNIKSFVSSKKSVKDQRMLIYYSNYRKDFLF